MAINAASAYQGAKINTATPAELTLMLYDGAIKFCNIANMAIEKEDMSKANENLIKAQKIISEFRATLNPKYSVAKDFDVMYEYVNYRLIEANMKKDTVILEEAMSYIRELREVWKELMKLN